MLDGSVKTKHVYSFVCLRYCYGAGGGACEYVREDGREDRLGGGVEWVHLSSSGPTLLRCDPIV